MTQQRMPVGYATIARTLLTILLVCPCAPAYGAEPADGSVSQRAIIKWTKTFSRRLRGLSLYRHSRRFLVSMQGNAGVSFADTNGQQKWDTSGAAEGLTLDGKRAVGDFGIRDLETGTIISTHDFATGKFQKVLLSEESGFIAVLPNFIMGRSPSRPFLDIYANDGNMVRDLSEMMANIVGEDVPHSSYFGAIAPPDGLAIYLQQPKNARLILFDIPSGRVVWNVAAPGPGISIPRIVPSKDRLYVELNLSTYASGKWDMAVELCAYSLSKGSQEWCQRGPYIGDFVLSDSGRHIVTTVSSNDYDSEGMPLYETWKTQLIDTLTGVRLWEKPYVGTPLYLSDSRDYIVALNRKDLNFVSLSGTIKRQLGLPQKWLADKSPSWRRTASFDAANETLLVAKDDSIICLDLSPAK